MHTKDAHRTLTMHATPSQHQATHRKGMFVYYLEGADNCVTF
jgi:hypothetical protein